MRHCPREEHTKERTLFYEGAIHRVFPRDSWVKFSWAYLIFKFCCCPLSSLGTECPNLSTLTSMFCAWSMSFKKSTSNKSLFLFCWLSFCVFMNFGPSHGNCGKMLTVIDRIRGAGPHPHFKHSGNNGDGGEWINEGQGCQKSTHTLHKPDYLCMAEMEKNTGGGQAWLSVRLQRSVEGPSCSAQLAWPPSHAASISHAT